MGRPRILEPEEGWTDETCIHGHLRRDHTAFDAKGIFCRKCKGLSGRTARAVRRKTFPGEVAVVARRSRIKVAYGISDEEYERLLASQGGCGICGVRPKAGQPRLAVDHNHQTGLIRGLLCIMCNYYFIGRWGDDPERYMKAEEYLTHPPALSVINHRYVPGSPGAEGFLL